MSLPPDLLRSRVRNEIRLVQEQLPHPITVSDPTIMRFPLQISVNLVRTPGPTLKNGVVTHRYEHRFQMHITDRYPYEKPIVRWCTPIFHPNIMPPEDGGYVCTKLLDEWSFSSSLVTFIKGIETMLANPNPKSPYGTESCLAAARHFSKRRYKAPVLVVKERGKPKVVG